MPEYAQELNKNDHHLIIWTPRFIILFAVVLVSGLSAESLLTEAWQNNHYSESLILAGHLIFLIITLVLLTRHMRSRWMRASTALGYAWTLLTLISIFLPRGGPFSFMRADMLAAASSALLGFFIVLSTYHTRLYRWDTIVFWAAPPIAALVLLIYIIIHPIYNDSIKELAETTTTLLLALSCTLWWLRPSCWHTRPCPTFLFGLSPLIIIFVTYWGGDSIGTRVFLSQLALLCLLLGIIRVIQEKQRIQYFSSATSDMFPHPKHLTDNSPHSNQNQHNADSVIEQMQ